MNTIINQYNFFNNVKLTDEGYVECKLETYVAPNEDGLDQYQTFLVLKLDLEGRLVITEKP
jgi:hypothetical protein